MAVDGSSGTGTKVSIPWLKGIVHVSGTYVIVKSCSPRAAVQLF